MELRKRCIGFLCKISEPVQKKIISPPGNVAVIRMEGVIGQTGRFSKGGITAKDYEPVIKKAFGLGHLKAVALVINSPGGSPVQSDLIARLIRQNAKEKEVPVLTFIEDVGASGGYWLACAGDEVFAMPSSIVGSIGVIAAGFGFQELINRYGIERRVYTSGKSKALLDPFQPEKEADIKVLKSAQKDVYEGFVEYVQECRGEKLTGKPTEVFSGVIYSGLKALDLGLVDGLNDFYSECRERFGDKIEFKELEPSKGFFAGKLAMLSPHIWAEAIAEILQQRFSQIRFH